MVEYIKQYVFSVCVSALVVTLIQMFLPQKGVSKVMKMAISVFFLSSLISPFLLDFDIDDEIEKYSLVTFEENTNLLEKTDEYIISQFELKIKELILTELKTIEVDPVNLEVKISKKLDESLYIESVKIFLTKNDMLYQTDVFFKVKSITLCEPQIYLSKVD